jgi:hypothetical protein
MSVLVLKVEDVESTKGHFEALGLVFVAERHGTGPAHWACEVDGTVLEIYPVGRDGLERIMRL